MSEAPYAFVELDEPYIGPSWQVWAVVFCVFGFIAALVAVVPTRGLGPSEALFVLVVGLLVGGAAGWALRRRWKRMPLIAGRFAARELLVQAMEGRLDASVSDDEICEAVLRANGANSATLGRFCFKELVWVEGVIGRRLPRVWVVNDPMAQIASIVEDCKAVAEQVFVYGNGCCPKETAVQYVGKAQGVGMLVGFLVGGAAGMTLGSALGRNGHGLTRKAHGKAFALEPTERGASAVRRDKRGVARASHTIDADESLAVVSGEQLLYSGQLAPTGSVVWRFFRAGKPGLIEAFDPDVRGTPWHAAFSAAMEELAPYRLPGAVGFSGRVRAA